MGQAISWRRPIGPYSADSPTDSKGFGADGDELPDDWRRSLRCGDAVASSGCVRVAAHRVVSASSPTASYAAGNMRWRRYGRAQHTDSVPVKSGHRHDWPGGYFARVLQSDVGAGEQNGVPFSARATARLKAAANLRLGPSHSAAGGCSNKNDSSPLREKGPKAPCNF